MARVFVIVLALCLAAIVPSLAQNRRSGCADQFRNCKMWAKLGECYHNAGFMYLSCPDACDQCNVEDPRCTDHMNMCPGWAKIGECRRNKSYMKKMCARSCAFCTPAKDHSVPHVHSDVVERIWNEFDSRNSV